MRINMINECELVYEADLRFTGTVEYGTSLQELSAGKITVPLTGARFDQTFVGVLRGPKLRGEIIGTDFLYVRPDGLFQLHLHARICTQDRMEIAFSSIGVSLPTETEDMAHIRATASLFTTHQDYLWVNKLHLLALGTLDLKEGTGMIKAYSP